MSWQALSAARDLGRLNDDISAVLIRYYGFGDLVRRTGMSGALERAGRALHWHAPRESVFAEPENLLKLIRTRESREKTEHALQHILDIQEQGNIGT